MATREPTTPTRQVDWDECFCCGDPFVTEQLDDNGLCTMCAAARAEYRRDGIPGGRPCCRRVLSEMRKRGEQP